MSNKPVLICVQPCTTYYAWQVEVMLDNFVEVGVTLHNVVQCLWAYNKTESDWQNKLALIKTLEQKFVDEDGIVFYYYEDTRQYPITYVSGIRPNLLKQHYKRFPLLTTEKVFYHDCDILFTKYPEFLDDLNVSETDWYVSDTISYIGHDYVISKGADVLDKMCQIVGCHPHFIKARQQQSGGCQYLFSNVDWLFWEKVEKDCEALFKQITELNNRKKALAPDYHELQIWCADMWAILWNAWLRGFTTNVVNQLSFVWATDPVTMWGERTIFHNAGVVADGQFFYKGSYTNRMPYDDIEEKIKTISPTSASYRYAESVLKTSKNSCYMIRKIREIVTSWAIAINPTEEQLWVAEQRLRVCKGELPDANGNTGKCEHIGDSLGEPYCKKCTCPLSGKVFVPRNLGGCPANKWSF
jgi:hypothetical protein